MLLRASFEVAERGGTADVAAVGTLPDLHSADNGRGFVAKINVNANGGDEYESGNENDDGRIPAKFHVYHYTMIKSDSPRASARGITTEQTGVWLLRFAQ